MKRFGLVILALLLLLASSSTYIQGSMVKQVNNHTVSKAKSSVQLAMTSPKPDATVNGDFFVTGIADDKKDGVETVEVAFSSLFDKKQQHVKAYRARYTPQGQWSTHVRYGDLPDDVYVVKVTMHSKDGNKQYLFSTVVVDSAQISKGTTL